MIKHKIYIYLLYSKYVIRKKKLILCFLTLLVVSGCSSIPKNISNACSIFSEKYFINDFPKYPMIDPINGRKIIAYSIYPFIPCISSTLIDPLFL